MIDGSINEIINLVNDILGSPRREAYVDGWTEYNCPCCAEENGNTVDGKYNFCINYSKGVGHCWKCGTSGRISKYVRRYGGADKLREYRNIVDEIRRSQQYSLEKYGITSDAEILKVENALTLPKDYSNDFTKDDRQAFYALSYLRKRGINDSIIKKYNIGYVGWTSEPNMSFRIIIPSYDEFGDLNYYIARDYSGKNNKRKYNNPEVPKTSYIFDEGMINWYEDITLVEGVFDHIVVPNSIPLLGKVLDEDNAVYSALINRAMANVNIMLDGDAVKDAKKLYYKLEDSSLKGRVRIIICDDGYDASTIYEKYGIDGIKKLMKSKRQLNDFDRIFDI